MAVEGADHQRLLRDGLLRHAQEALRLLVRRRGRLAPERPDRGRGRHREHRAHPDAAPPGRPGPRDPGAARPSPGAPARGAGADDPVRPALRGVRGGDPPLPGPLRLPRGERAEAGGALGQRPPGLPLPDPPQLPDRGPGGARHLGAGGPGAAHPEGGRAAGLRRDARQGGLLPRAAIFRWVLGNARLGVKNRENMRFARTRIYGLLRELLRAVGEQLRGRGPPRHPRGHLLPDHRRGLGLHPRAGRHHRSPRAGRAPQGRVRRLPQRGGEDAGRPLRDLRPAVPPQPPAGAPAPRRDRRGWPAARHRLLARAW